MILNKFPISHTVDDNFLTAWDYLTLEMDLSFQKGLSRGNTRILISSTQTYQRLIEIYEILGNTVNLMLRTE